MSWFRSVTEGLLIRRRNSVVSSRSQELGTYRTSLGGKPPRIGRGNFELFHRSRPLRIAIQVVGLGALAIWTIRNYIHVLHSL